MWGRRFWYRLAVTTMYISAGMIPIYLNVKNLGLMNNFWVYIVLHLFSAYNMILVKTYMESLPPSLEESAEIDGAGYLTRFFRIVLPLSKPILATIGLFSAVTHWNNMFDTKMYITKQKLFTVQYVLYQYYLQVQSLQETLDEFGNDPSILEKLASSTTTRLTMTAVTVIPVMCVYPFIQKYYMKGVMIGAVKG
jgi:multiple sugar transport system permease protein/putative aldouronate transport system permease protein